MRNSTNISGTRNNNIFFKLTEDIIIRRCLLLKILNRKVLWGKYYQKKPKTDLKSLLGENKKGSTLLSGQALHKYLIENKCKKYPGSCPKVYQIRTFTSLENVLDKLRLTKQNSNTHSASINYGEWLNVAFELRSIEKPVGTL